MSLFRHSLGHETIQAAEQNKTKKQKDRKTVNAYSKENHRQLPQEEDIDIINFRVNISFTNKH